MTGFKNGSVKISDDLIDQLIAETALTVEGVIYVIGYKNNKIEKNRKDGIVSVVDNNNNIKIALSVIVDDGIDLYDTANLVQKTIKEQIHTMLGFNVQEVNVFVKSTK